MILAQTGSQILKVLFWNAFETWLLTYILSKSTLSMKFWKEFIWYDAKLDHDKISKKKIQNFELVELLKKIFSYWP